MLSLSEFKNKLHSEGMINWHSEINLEQFWCFSIKATSEQLWPYLSDTERMNRELELTPRKQIEKNGQLFVTTKMLGIEQAWLEKPWSWKLNCFLTYTRVYEKGLARLMHGVFYLEKINDGYTNIYIYLGWQPRNYFWNIFLKLTDSPIRKKFHQTFSKVENYIRSHQEVVSNKAYQKPPKPLTTSEIDRLEKLRTELFKLNLENKVVEKLCEYIKTADDLELDAIRVIRLANSWGKNYKDVLAVCLHATRLGLLNISWSMVCPHCRGSRFSAGSLGDVPANSSCEPCGIDFTTDQSEAIEVIFKVNESVRKVPSILYCAAEPAKKSHIKLQQVVSGNQTLQFKLELPEGTYRARYAKMNSKAIHLSSSYSDSTFDYVNNKQTEINLGLKSEVILKNTDEFEKIFVIEELFEDKTLLRPAQLLSFQKFRDLFAEEHLSSNVKLNLGEQTILFTDIVGSTKFYQKVGDAKAFSVVRSHFQDVFSEVRKNEGVVVKTIGDAVMASFPSLHDAYSAAINIHRLFSPSRADAIRLRISIHRGPVIAVQLNTGMDYFGNVVNFGAKIQSCAGAGEIAFKKDIFEDLKQKSQLSVDYKIIEKAYASDATTSVAISVVQVN